MNCEKQKNIDIFQEIQQIILWSPLKVIELIRHSRKIFVVIFVITRKFIFFKKKEEEIFFLMKLIYENFSCRNLKKFGKIGKREIFKNQKDNKQN